MERSAFETCWPKVTAQGLQVSDSVIEVVEVYDDSLDIIDIPQTQAKAVTLRFNERTTIDNGDTKLVPLGTDTSHAIYVDGLWRWVFDNEFASALEKTNACPTQ